MNKTLMQTLYSTVKELLDSKKFVTSFVASLAAMVVSYCGKKNIIIDPEIAKEAMTIIMGGVATFVLSQGVADHGKERVKAEQAPSPTPPSPT
jgi:hypothetical protein